MNGKRDSKGRRVARRRGFSVESLERRSLLTATTETFTGPSLTDLIKQSEHGKNPSQQEVNRMLRALESQLQSGPLTDLGTGAVDTNGFITEAQSLETSFEQNADQQLSRSSPTSTSSSSFRASASWPA